MSESQNIEYKESWRDEYLRQICGLANAKGGSLFVGVNDRGEVVGVANAKIILTAAQYKSASTSTRCGFPMTWPSILRGLRKR